MILEREIAKKEKPLFTSLKRRELPYIPLENRLVPREFTYGEEEMRKEVIAGINKPYEAYPSEKFKLTEDEFDGMSRSELISVLVGTPEKRPPYFYDMPHRYDPSTGLPKDGEDIRTMTAEDFVHTRLHPYLRDMVTQTERGVTSGPGFYYRLGPNKTADSVILRQHHGKLQILLVDRSDHGGLALPGGMVDPKELTEKADPVDIARRVAIREVGEEAGIKGLEHVSSEVILQDAVVGDFRATPFAWPETTVVMFTPEDEEAEGMVAMPDKKEVTRADWSYVWKDLTQGNLFGSHPSYIKLAIQQWQEKTGLVVDKEGTIGTGDAPENFRGEGQFGYFPQRIVNETPRLERLKSIIGDFTSDKKVAERLFDLVVYNAYGRVHPIPNSCSDFVGVVDPERKKSGFKEAVHKAKRMYDRVKYRNCVALVKVGGQLALVGGYNDIGEAMTQTTAREAYEESGAKHITNALFFSERSIVNRDNGPIVISSCGTGLVDKDELQPGDDAGGANAKVYIVKLRERGQFNSDISRPGKHRDVDGTIFEHNGMRGDHTELLKQLYNYWQDHKRKPWESLASVIKRQSRIFPQEWFTNYAQHPAGLDTYDSFTVDGRSTLLTPNITFALEKVEAIFKDAGYEDAKEKARTFVSECASAESDILPPFPQAGVAVDCLVVKGNNLVVQKMPDGSYRLPGSFYSPEKIQAGASLSQFANETVSKRFGGIDFNAHLYLGTVGGDVATGELTDPRYPRLSHVYVGRTTADYDPHPEFFRQRGEDVEIVEIPIWADENHTTLSPEITKATWGFSHNREIIEPLFGRAMTVLQERHKGMTAEELLLQERLAA